MAQLCHIFPCGKDEYLGEPTRFNLCPKCLKLIKPGEQSCPHCGTDLMPVRVTEPVSSLGNRSYGGMLLCPGCGSQTGLSLVGVRSSTELGALLSLLFASRFNDDKKLLAFSDSVQDAAYRAGFFNARTWNFTLRGALQKFVQDQEPVATLKGLREDFPRYWLEKLGEERFVETFIPSSLTYMRGWEYLCEHGKIRHDDDGNRMLAWISLRLKYEAALAWGMASRRGRTLEKSGASVLSLGLDRLCQAGVIASICARLVNENGTFRGFTEAQTAQLVGAWLYHMKRNGAICLEEEFAGFVRSGCVDYMLRPDPRKGSYLWMPAVHKGVNVPRFVSIKRVNENIDSLGEASWYSRYLKKMLDDLNMSEGLSLAGADAFTQAAQIVMDELVKDGLVTKWTADRLGSAELYGLNPEKLKVSTSVLRGRCGGEDGTGGESIFIAPEDRCGFEDALCPRIGCGGRLRLEPMEPDYYGRLYKKGDLCHITAKEHTGLLTRDERENVENAFKRGGELHAGDANVLSCTPTLEMGIDIGGLSTVMLCSVPPGQAQFAQRTGRAGRKDGNALTITVANSREHDLYYYAAPEELLAGTVETPHVFMQASAVLERQFTAYCFDCWVKEKSQSGADLRELVPAKLGACLNNLRSGEKWDLANRTAAEVFPGNFLNYVKTNAERLLNTFRGLFVYPENMTEETFALLQNFVLGDGTAAGKSIDIRIVEAFIEQKQQLEVLKKRIKSLRERKKELKNHPDDPSWQKELNVLEREREAWCRVERSLAGKDLFGFFSDESLMPNYAFPEEGMTLKAILYRRAEEEERETRRNEGLKRLPRTTIHEYQRPAASAISEFAPENEFYAGGRKLAIDQVDLNASKIEEWRFCPECSHMELETSLTPKASCPRCGAAGWADGGQKRALLRAKMVYSTMEYASSLISDDAEERPPHFYNKQLLVDVDESDITGAYTYEDADFPFGFEFARKAVIRDVNFGDTDVIGEKMRVNGHEDVRKGFKVCKGCGKVVSHEALRNGKFAHAIGCKYNGTKDENAFADCLFLYREFSTEVLRLLIPATLNARSEETKESFVAAVMLGLKQEFGNVDHLRAAFSDMPETGSANRRQYLVIYDSVPGGTGYLKGFSEAPKSMTRVLQKSLKALEECRCRFDDTKDGCYRCLYAFRIGRTAGNLSRRRAIELLRGILKGTPKKVNGLSKISIGRLEESELETNFIAALDKLGRLRRRLVNGKSGYALEVKGASDGVVYEWEIEPQVKLDADDGVSVACCPDFVLWPKVKRNGETKLRLKDTRKPVAIFADGFTFHRDKTDDDTLKRMALLRTNKFRVWSVNWEDVQAVFSNTKELPSGWPLKTTYWRAVLDGLARKQNVDQHDWLTNSELSSPMFLLLAYLGGGRDIEKIGELFSAHANAAVMAYEKGFSPEHIPAWQVAATESCEACNLALPAAQTAAVCTDIAHIKALLSVGLVDSTPVPAVVLYLNDSNESEDFERSWKIFWRMSNLCQFLPFFCMVTKRGLENGLYLQLPQVEEVEADAANDAWSKIFKYLLPDELELARGISQTGVRAPDDVGVEIVLPDGRMVSVTLVWKEERVAWLFAQDEETERHLCADGWKVFVGESFPGKKDFERSVL
ncbi:MAG: DUF1998 domain-containing protein [Pyramidobacter sp.]|nr:DUF1998 domain-containing protein [Pyramidobacter sp.]